MDETRQAIQVLLSDQANDQEAQRLLAPVGFRDGQTVWRHLPELARDERSRTALAACLPCVFEALGEAANPDRAWVNFERFSQGVADQRALFDALAQNPRLTETLVVLFSSSQFLTEILLRNPEYLDRLSLHKHLAQRKTVEQFCRDARGAVAQWSAPLPPAPPLMQALEALRKWQRWEWLRVGACDLFGLLDLESVTHQLSNLAQALVQTCLALVADDDAQDVSGFAVVALGKLGGRELNYSSDIDLLFVASSNPTQFRRLAEHLIDALTRISSEGFLYRVDMRLRPWGQSGALVSTCQGFETYVQHHARGWEKQALLKARFLAGDPHIVKRLLEHVGPLIATVPRQLRQEIHAMRQRSQTHLRQRGRLWGEVKSGPGSIRDVEFVAQFLQRLHGQAQPQVLSTNTLESLSHLRDASLLDEPAYRTLTDGYTFLRTLEHHLQIMHYQQTHALPSDLDELSRLARRLGFEGAQGKAQLLEQYEHHQQAISAVYQAHLGEVQEASNHVPSRAQRHLGRMHPAYERTFKPREIERHVALAEKLAPEHLVEVEAVAEEHGTWRVTIVGYDYLGELSLICGLFVVYGLNILSGHVFSYEPVPTGNKRRLQATDHRPRAASSPATKIVDVFRVNSASAVCETALQDYAQELESLLQLLHAGKSRQAHTRLAKRVAAALRERASDQTPLYPVEIDIDNDRSRRYTVLRIRSLDTPGFLYEFSNALTLNGVSIVRVEGRSARGNVDDVLFVSDARGQKITDAQSQEKLRVATVLVKHFTHLLPLAPNPASALLHFRQLVAQLFSRPHWPRELASLERPDVLDALARLLGTSDFLWNDFLRMQHQNLFPVLSDTAALTLPQTKAQLQDELGSALAEATADNTQTQALNAFKDRQMFRIDMRHILGNITFEAFSAELSDLAETVVTCATQLCFDELERLFGRPLLPNRSPCPLSVCGLGKCGGRELGFASDIELLFLYAGNGQTSGPRTISTTEFYEKLVERFLGLIRSKREGVFEIDLRLRPYGKAGSMAVPLEAFQRYYARDGEAWAYERQALVKLRPIAGDRAFGQDVVALRDRLIFGNDAFDPVAVRAMRQRQIRHLVSGGTLNVKFSPGGLVDLEYLVQGLQMRSERAEVWHACNTRRALDALKTSGVLASSDHERLRRAHDVLSRLIDALRMARGNAKDLTCPPTGSDALAFLAQRLGYAQNPQRLHRDLVEQMAWVQRFNDALLR